MTSSLPHHEIYSEPHLYDWAFSYRDIPREVDFLLATYEAVTRKEPTSAVEFASGPARHALEMAKRRMECQAVDLSEPMLRYGRSLARDAGVRVRYVLGDMRHQPAIPPVDLATCLLCSSSYLVHDQDMIAHLQNVDRSLLPGGVCILEMPHPSELLGDQKTRSAWTITRPDGLLNVEWSDEATHEGAPPGTSQMEAVLRWQPQGEGSSVVVTGRALQRTYSLEALTACLGSVGRRLKVWNVYGAFDSNVNVTHPSAWRMIVVLRKEPS